MPLERMAKTSSHLGSPFLRDSSAKARLRPWLELLPLQWRQELNSSGSLVWGQAGHPECQAQPANEKRSRVGQGSPRGTGGPALCTDRADFSLSSSGNFITYVLSMKTVPRELFLGPEHRKMM